MPRFSGVHGTITTHAANIQAIGFVILEPEKYKRMFGNGVYMYKNDENGKLYAKEWAKSKILNENLIDECDCIIFADFDYNDNEHITWSDEEEIEFNAWLKRNKDDISPGVPLNRKIQNEYRTLFLSVAAERMNVQYKVVFANMPFPKHLSEHGSKRYSACAVKDASILPSPPFLQE